jgi:hypothetical protein
MKERVVIGSPYRERLSWTGSNPWVIIMKFALELRPINGVGPSGISSR